MRHYVRRFKEIHTGLGSSLAYGPIHRAVDLEHDGHLVLEPDETSDTDPFWIEDYWKSMNQNEFWRGRLKLPLREGDVEVPLPERPRK